MNRIYILLFLLILHPVAFSQMISNEDRVYDDNIQTVLLYRDGDQLNEPVIRLNTDDKLRLSFDDFSDESYLFKYTLIHCNEYWEPSNLSQIEYLDGYFEDEINKYYFSFNAIPGYIHYSQLIPSPNMRIKLSGNYILKVYLEDPSEANVLFTKRFYVVEQLVNVDASIPYYPKDLMYTRKKQQIDLAISTPDLFNAEPLQRISLTIRQNGRWDNAKMGIKATSVLMNELQYHYPNGIVFDGGNEFRNFDMKSFQYQSMYIKRIVSEKDGYIVILHDDYSKVNKPYATIADINGKKLIRARSDQVTMIEGEYAMVQFTLKHPKIANADVYILGALNSWQLDEKSRMNYSSSAKQYYCDMLLKQGYYDYAYVVVPQGSTEGDITVIEGDHWETKNSYTVIVYYRDIVPAYDRIIGYQTFSSFKVSIK